MSVETDVAEIKSTLKSMNEKLDLSIEHQAVVCKIKHVPIEEHMKDGPTFRDKVNWQGGALTVLISIVSILTVGILGIAWVVIQKVMGG